MTNQAALYTLASTLCSYPQVEHLQELEALLPLLAQADDALSAGLYQMLSQWTEAHIVDLQSDYIDLFDRGHAQNPIYETEYGRNRSISKTTELADLAGFYQAFGLMTEGLPEMQDHISVELEFYAWLLLKSSYLESIADKEGIEIVQKAQLAFLKQHLGGFSQSLPECTGVKEHPEYSLIFRWVSQLVKQSCEHFEIEPDPVSFFTNQREPEEFDCSTLGGCGVPAATAAEIPLPLRN